MVKTVIPGYNGFAEWTPESKYGAGMVGYADKNAKTPVWDGTAFVIDDGSVGGESFTSPNKAKWIGPVANFKINDNVVASSVKYLKAHGEAQRSVSVIHSKAVEEVTVELETTLQPRMTTGGSPTAINLVAVDGAFGPFLYCIGDGSQPSDKKNAIGEVVGAGLNVFLLGDNIGSVAFSAGIENSGTSGTDTNYMAFWGCKCQEATLSIAEDENIKMTATYACGGVIGPTVTDYIGAANHAAQPNPMMDPLAYEAVQNLKYRTKAPCDAAWSAWADFDPVRSIEISVSNDLKLIKDVGAPDHLKKTRIVNAVILNREVTVTLEIDYNSFGLFTKVRDFNEFDIAFDIKYASCATYEKAARIILTGIKFTEMPLELSPEDIIGDSMTSLPISGMSIEDLDYDTPVELPDPTP